MLNRVSVPGLKELALKVTNDPDHKFDLSLQLDDLDATLDIARTVRELEVEPSKRPSMAVGRFDLTRERFKRSGDLIAWRYCCSQMEIETA